MSSFTLHPTRELPPLSYYVLYLVYQSDSVCIVHILSISVQLRLYAKYYRSRNCMILPDDYKARVTSWDERHRFFDDDGVVYFFTFVLLLPIGICVIFVLYVIGVRNNVKKLLKKPDHYSSQAALVCVGQTYTLFVAIMDSFALNTKAIHKGYANNIIWVICIVEYMLFSFTFAIVILFCCIHSCCYSHSSKFGGCKERCKSVNCCMCVCSVCKWLKLWFVIVGLIPPLVCLSSHIGIVIEGWASYMKVMEQL